MSRIGVVLLFGSDTPLAVSERIILAVEAVVKDACRDTDEALTIEVDNCSDEEWDRREQETRDEITRWSRYAMEHALKSVPLDPKKPFGMGFDDKRRKL